MWIARDKSGGLFLYNVKPKKSEEVWFVSLVEDIIPLDRDSFPEVKWTDRKPTEVKLVKVE